MSNTYLYKILDQDPLELPEKLPATDLDTQDGFIHLSTALQTPITASLFFGTHTELWILKLDTSALDGRIEYSTDPKAGIENGCAHLHDSEHGLGRGNVVQVVKAVRPLDKLWVEVDSMIELQQSR